jgi:2,3-bisphosphoglycerate-independent phosphoglycerate mutase
MPKRPRPMVLIVLEGWGYSESADSNAIYGASKPVWDHLWRDFPHTLIRGSGAEVGLPADQMGNSEVGHLNLGAGRVVLQEFTRVGAAIKSGAFFSNATLTAAVDRAKQNNGSVHILGLLSTGGVHSHEDHIFAMAELAAKRGARQVYLHAFTDGRDTAPKSALDSIANMEAVFKRFPNARFASLIGRYFAMDRDHRWSRTEAAYRLITEGHAAFTATDAASAVAMAYARGESDEFMQTTAIVPPGQQPVRVQDGDVVVFMNYRSDRARQLTRAFIEPDFSGFQRHALPQLGAFVTLTSYSEDFHIPVAYPSERVENVFGEYLSNLGLRQLRIAETEKYAHVTFFFNGGVEAPFPGEDRILVPSPKVATYDLQPEMNAAQLTDRLVEAIHGDGYDVIICNYANPDMVGHTGNYAATVKAIETIDLCLGRVVEATRQRGGELLITADHGNAELLRNEATGQAHTAHTFNPVPFIYIGRPATTAPSGALSDVAPTMLYLMGIERPPQMDGNMLVKLL